MSALFRSLQIQQIYGANTNVGKSIVSGILSKALTRQRPDEKSWYLKPVSTGPLSEADISHISKFSPQTNTKCLFQFEDPVSPHIAAAKAQPPPDGEILAQIQQYLKDCAQQGPGSVLVETAGGVHSPTPNGSSQADLYRPLRLPVVLVADSKLGGISTSISAFESLHIRGYDLDSVVVFEDDYYKNFQYLREFFEKKNIKTYSVPPPPERIIESEENDAENMRNYYEKMSTHASMEEMLSSSKKSHQIRLERLEEMSTKAYEHIWYPFTQHKDLSPSKILTIDSAYGDDFQTLKQNVGPEDETAPVLQPTFDSSASWWTQGLGHGNPDLALAAANAAGRYGHVMFAGAIHQPALSLAQALLTHLENPRLNKVFYSDNGSTGIEVALKMAFTATCQRYGWGNDVGVLGLKGSYHGDTIGAMDASEPGTFNEKVHWYEGKGYWFDFPKVKMVRGKWIVEVPEDLKVDLGGVQEFASLDEIFDLESRRSSQSGKYYRWYIEDTLERLVVQEGKKFGALLMEPVILGAGGMLFADPLFQYTLASVVRKNTHLISPMSKAPTDDKSWSGLPVIHDEVFTGIYRLGRFSPSSFLDIHPDISVHAKLLTGGLLPLCATAASDSIYDAFLSNEKKDALLHGHSYTAHAIGCQVAEASIGIMNAFNDNGGWETYRRDWASVNTGSENKTNGAVWSCWSSGFVNKISLAANVESVVALGSVLAINLHDSNESGYSSTAAVELQAKLLSSLHVKKNIHSRNLGNMIYFMASPVSRQEDLAVIEEVLLKEIV